MKLVFRGHDERYVVEQSLMNLFPGELPVYEPITPGDDSWAVISLEETGDLCRVAVSLCRGGKTTEQTYQEPLSGGDFQREGLRRHAVGACFFLAARYTSRPWPIEAQSVSTVKIFRSGNLSFSSLTAMTEDW